MVEAIGSSPIEPTAPKEQNILDPKQIETKRPKPRKNSGATVAITLPDGSVKELPSGVTGNQIAEAIGPGLARVALAIEIDGEVRDLSRTIDHDASVKILRWEDEGGKFAYWHSSAHLMAESIEALFPGTKFGIGPPIEQGFYYDIDMGDHKIGPGDLASIEEKMYEFAKRDVSYIREEKSWDDAELLDWWRWPG